MLHCGMRGLTKGINKGLPPSSIACRDGAPYLNSTRAGDEIVSRRPRLAQIASNLFATRKLP
ncbi:MAG: hypothetical protein AVDCRST_MAG18-833 [uncultured Thermomicrobiales bacterium]|uniref:Uncharacterized protein n=1 Tax=uncultured Thermomicrobiales bacterium TaxID=1645740 RepID=A0A6J4UTX2_9BACT|nr:MAG: hypothetical protein AVDCRST_MAG18-833 [uncultured Thermomicrobiales bacterium]